MQDSNLQVSVLTVVTPPHWQVKDADLTRELVAELRRRGFDARWTSRPGPTVRCTVMPQDSVELRESATIIARWHCEVAQRGRILPVDTTATVFSNTLAETYADVLYASAAQAIPRIGAKIEAILEEPQ